jgi:hypothetical protein
LEAASERFLCRGWQAQFPAVGCNETPEISLNPNVDPSFGTYPRVRALLLASLDQVEPCANLPGSLSYTCDSNARRGNEVTPVRISHYGQPFQGSRGMAGCAASFLPLSRGRALAAPCPARRSAWKSCYPSAGKPYRCVEMKPGYPQLELALTWRFVFGRF